MKYTLQDLYIIVSRFSSKRQMSVRRLQKIAYLLDWHMAFKDGIKASDTWVYGICGPSDASLDVLLKNSSQYFELVDVDNHYGSTKKVVRCKECSAIDDYSNVELNAAIDRVYKYIYNLSWDELVRIVMSTHPVVKSRLGDTLDLTTAAKEYKIMLAHRV